MIPLSFLSFFGAKPLHLNNFSSWDQILTPPISLGTFFSLVTKKNLKIYSFKIQINFFLKLHVRILLPNYFFFILIPITTKHMEVNNYFNLKFLSLFKH